MYIDGVNYCNYCGQDISARRFGADTCSTRCRVAWHRKLRREGKLPRQTLLQSCMASVGQELEDERVRADEKTPEGRAP